jgi:hypothetical protein
MPRHHRTIQDPITELTSSSRCPFAHIPQSKASSRSQAAVLFLNPATTAGEVRRVRTAFPYKRHVFICSHPVVRSLFYVPITFAPAATEDK